MNFSIPNLSHFFICFLLFFPVSVNAQTDENQEKDEASISKKHNLPEAFSESASVWVLGEEDFNKGNIVNVWDLIQGRVPGLLISNSGGEPGGAVSVINRNALVPDGAIPLVVIDGMPLNSRFPEEMRNQLNFLHPSDIESVIILKDGAAQSLYGMLAGNGVVIINTKRTLKDAPLRLEYSSHASLAQVTSTIDVLNGPDFRNLVNERYAQQPNAINRLGQGNTFWQDEIYRNSISHNHHLAAGGNAASIPWRAALNYSDHQGVLKTDGMNRLGGQLNINPVLLDNHLRVNFNIHASRLENRFAPQQAIGYATGFDPTQPVLDSGSPYGGYFTWTTDNGLPQSVAMPNPVAYLDLNEDIGKTNSLLMHTLVSYDLHFFPDLSVDLQVSRQNFNSERNHLIPGYASWQYFSGGMDSRETNDFANQLLEGRLNYRKNLPGIKSRINIMAGVSRQKFRNEYSWFMSNLEGNLANEPYMVMADFDGWSESNLASFSTHVDYTFDDRYFLHYSYRNDRSSRFSEENRSAGYHSAAGAWKLHNESFWPEDFVLSRLKLRAGYGVSGFIPVFAEAAISYDIKPERITTLNMGFEYALLQNRIFGTLDYYQGDRSDMPTTVMIPAGTGWQYIITSEGNMNFSGFEFSINTLPVTRENFTWRLGAHISGMKNEIVSLYDITDDYPGISLGPVAGSFGNSVLILTNGYPSSSFYVYESIYDADGLPLFNLYVDQDGDGQITDADRIRYKTPFPDYYLGISSQLHYNNWNFAFSGRAGIGNYVYNNTSSYFGNYSRLYRPEGPYLGNITAEAVSLNFDYGQYLSDYYVQDASFFRMDYISLGYDFRNLREGALNLQLTATVQNAFVITGYEGLDPEVPSGIDFNSYPRPRIFTLGVKVGF
ncbi:MAG: TonB-dependent receptor plug domain-containing protein [Bacteroidales bacterium]|nr:TonB-dependent receptor plug domain-containing protein [Bacteroidales bacterium]